MNQEFENKVALVTGAGSGIGRELVNELVKLNVKVIAVSQTKSKLESLSKSIGENKVTIIAVDLSNWNETEEKLSEVCKNVDYLINNAGCAFNCKVDEAMPLEQVNKLIDINLKAPINLIRLVAEGMKNRRQGAIVNVSSVSGIAAQDELGVYSASKAGLDMFMKVSAKELGPFNIRVNSVNPTVVWTSMGQELWTEPKRKATMIAKIPMGRFVQVDEVIKPIIFLLSSGASMVNGITLPIDGGYVAT